MTIKCLLIGFECSDNISHDKLPSLEIDLYNAYKYCAKLVTNLSDIQIVTDIKHVDMKKISHAILTEKCQNDVDDFLNYILSPVSNEYSPKTNIIKDLTDFIVFMENYDYKTDKIIVYYSGHAENGNVVLPDGQMISTNYLLNMIINKCSDETEIVFIIDCCNVSNMGLPFSLIDNAFILRKKDLIFRRNRILLIAGSTEYQTSLSTCFGSLFTRCLFPLLISIINREEKIVSYGKLVKKVSENMRKDSCHHIQNPMIYTSKKETNIIKPWLLNFSLDINCHIKRLITIEK